MKQGMKAEKFILPQIGRIFELFVDEIDLARMVLSCHIAVDLLCDKEGAHDSA